MLSNVNTNDIHSTTNKETVYSNSSSRDYPTQCAMDNRWQGRNYEKHQALTSQVYGKEKSLAVGEWWVCFSRSINSRYVEAGRFFNPGLVDVMCYVLRYWNWYENAMPQTEVIALRKLLLVARNGIWIEKGSICVSCSATAGVTRRKTSYKVM